MTTDNVQMITITTPLGLFEVFTRQAGTSSRIKVLMLHGGPGASHDYLLDLEDPLVAAGFQVHFYDQLGSAHSDQPQDPSLWTVERFTDELEQVRQALGLGADDFVLWGHSWGGVLGIEYALAHPGSLKGLVVSNMVASGAAYNDYARSVLMPRMDQDALAEIQHLEAGGRTGEPRHDELLFEHYYIHHLLRREMDQWPANLLRSFELLNHDVYGTLQGTSELTISGRLLDWDRTAALEEITVPTLVMGAEHDTMDPAHLRWMADQLPSGRYHHTPNAAHFAFHDDPDTYAAGLVGWLRQLEAESLPRAAPQTAPTA